MDAKALFDAIRKVKGGPLTTADVNLVNAALGSTIAAVHKTGLKASAAGVALIHTFETLELKAYPDPGSRDGKPVTCGWGTTVDEGGGPIPLGAVWSVDKADRLFARDLSTVEVGVNMLLGGKPCTQGQFDALVSFAYNVGLDIDADLKAEGLGDSTLLRKHLAGDYAGAQAQFALWNKNDGVVMKGLTRRRAAEAALYGSAT